MYKTQRLVKHEAFGDFCHRVGIPAIEEFMGTYEPGAYKKMADPFAPQLVKTDSTVGIDSELLETLQAEATPRGYDAATMLDIIVREALDSE